MNEKIKKLRKAVKEAAKIPKWFDTWLLKQKTSTRAVGTRFFWEIIAWAAFVKGRQMGRREGIQAEKDRVTAIINCE